uniref:Uncharacterized protein n=1 Tax=Rousettus aegyptiacus TaxID=9407 RepID=A0A7J8JGE2_ROUAE|nr:hypothetical protein HJG63_010137 [Rousettus aegyptiacus]
MTSGHSVPEKTGKRNKVPLVGEMEQKRTEGEVFEQRHCEKTPVLSMWARLPSAWWVLGLRELSTERQNKCSWRAGTKSTPALENFQHVGLENVLTAKQSFPGGCHSFPYLTLRAKAEVTKQEPACPD